MNIDIREDSLHLLLTKTFHAQRNMIRPRLLEVGLCVGQPKVLHYLYDHGACMQKELAAFCNVEPATMSKMLDTMEKNGLIKRMDVAGNRRAFHIVLTEEGLASLAKWEKICEEADERSLQGFTEEEKGQYRHFLNRMYENISGK